MNNELSETRCAAYRDALLRHGCREPVSAELRAHLDDCPQCQERLMEERELLDALRGALAPDPLSTAFEAELRERVRAAVRPRRARWLAVMPLVPAVAVAACFWFVVLISNEGPKRAEPTGDLEVAISTDDADAIVSALTLLRWDSAADYSIDVLTARVQTVAKQFEHTGSGESGLPWAAAEDWDMPGSEPGTSGAGLEPNDARVVLAAPAGDLDPA